LRGQLQKRIAVANAIATGKIPAPAGCEGARLQCVGCFAGGGGDAAQWRPFAIAFFTC